LSALISGQPERIDVPQYKLSKRKPAKPHAQRPGPSADTASRNEPPERRIRRFPSHVRIHFDWCRGSIRTAKSLSRSGINACLITFGAVRGPVAKERARLSLRVYDGASLPGRSRGHARSAGSNIFSKKEVRAKGGRKIGGRGETNGGQGASEKILFKGVVIWVGNMA